jgi:hypothetical protein
MGNLLSLLSGPRGLPARALNCCICSTITLSTLIGANYDAGLRCCRWSLRYSICWRFWSEIAIGSSSKDDLLAAVWGGRIVSESTLGTRINAARRIIGDSGEQQRLIRTTIGKGVRFVGAVQERYAAAETAISIPPRLSIIVLPFANLSNDPFRRWYHRRSDHRSLADTRQIRDRPQHGLYSQGPIGRRKEDRS